jgi:hypothetical protein
MSAYTEIICPCTTHQAQYKKYSSAALTPPSGSYSPSLKLGTGISAHWLPQSKLYSIVVLSKPRISIFDEMTFGSAVSNDFICKQTPLTI